jgi:N-acetylglucosamine-6-sulfatase
VRPLATRRLVALSLAVLSLAAAEVRPGHVPVRSSDPRPNIVVIVTDDQTADTLPSTPDAMPFLQSQIEDTTRHWITFPNAFDETPLCCPSRATMLTGLDSRHTGVLDNGSGNRLDESQTLPVWLHGAGYHTMLIGKYLNGYPFGRGPYVPPGWDRFVAKLNLSAATTYYGYPFIDQGVPMRAGAGPAFYSTDFLAREAVSAIRTAPSAQPFFLYFAPVGPHAPWTGAPRDAGTFARASIPVPPSVNEADVSDKPAWVQALPSLDGATLDLLQRERRSESETLRSVDDAVREVLQAVADRGATADTIVFFLTDNGYSFGGHRWIGKTCPYEECIHTPFTVLVPGTVSRTDPALVTTADLASTIAGLAGVRPPIGQDGVDLAPSLLGTGPDPARPGVLTEYDGAGAIPPWTEVRTADFAYIETARQGAELYDLSGALGPADPFELDNRVSDLRYAATAARLARLLAELRSHAPGSM